METVVGIVCIIAVVCVGLYGVFYEIKTMKAARLKEQKQIELCELLIRKLEDYDRG